ncbi:MAG TPA: elongation factor P, partial [Bacilli bacterium]|nr:elongation factor P [Bacilli bacterium]
EIAQIEKKKMQFSYTTTDTYCFMDMETFEQVELPSERLKWESNFLLEGMEVEIVCYGSEILGINLPEKVVLEVVESAPAVAGNTATAALKEVKMETGLVVKVPMFVNQGDKLIISTSDGKYSSRA